ncbi:HAD-IA family hydrolase [Marinovum sp. 2_MG-2023]|uniref:HAD-IA family hydrolase n=1 Tax=Roseobacteraceae TaxID=2854170 RepID=UPI001FD4B7AE|nr:MULTISPECIES: HAD-IA family hydrolase [Roseobacteraceae]MCJ7872461.1 HAD-IA family hydrolase [Phaeobacter sp. J2-8]MDO6732494.1 HAD-IA family hydrolase [Marinovum sp. 2_MG-2023]MDO6780524.1 HAD-IA family hydrolase [Marinovum sp. 1_MG-2023]
MRTVIFDLDGTLADTSGDLIAAANACFRDMGAGDVLDPVRDAGTALRGGRAMLTLGLARMGRGDDAAAVAQWYPRLLSEYDRALDHQTVLYPGAIAAIKALLADGFRVGVCTNKPEAMADKLLVSLGVRDLFGSLVGADTLPVRKPDAAPYVAAVERAGGKVAQSVLIGDSDTDRETARAAGVPCVLVTFGPSGEDMAALQPEALLHDYDDLHQIVCGLIKDDM